MTNRYLIGNAQTIGCREIQNNYFSTVYNDAGDLLAVLADGAIDHRNGRMAAIVAVGSCVGTFTQKFSDLQPDQTGEFLMDMALKAKRQVQDVVYIGKIPRISLTMALFKDQTVYYFGVGTNKIFLYNGHNERILGENAANPYSCGKCEIEYKNVIGILSAGAHSNAHPMERLKIMESKAEINDKAQAIIESVSKKNLIIQQNATALLIEVAK